jgi:very-short-patch-repair endonuclease
MNTKYNNLNDNEKKQKITQLYEVENKSFQDIAVILDTYANKIRRDAIRFKINIRNKSDAQKNALKTGKHAHPTKGKIRDDITKYKIGNAVLKSWDSLSQTELANRKHKAKENWNNLSQDEKILMQQKANNAVRESSKVGSKLEKFILNSLLKDGYKVNFHQEQTLSNTKLQIDIVLPTMNTAIEIDGPSHFLPVWGEDSLKKNITYDQKKSGLILGKGMVIIRIKQLRDYSNTRAQNMYNELSVLLKQINSKFPDSNNRSFIIEDK